MPLTRFQEGHAPGGDRVMEFAEMVWGVALLFTSPPSGFPSPISAH